MTHNEDFSSVYVNMNTSYGKTVCSLVHSPHALRGAVQNAVTGTPSKSREVKTSG